MPVRWPLRRNLAAPEQELRRARPQEPNAAVNRRPLLLLLPTDSFDRGNNQRHRTEDFRARGYFLNGSDAQSFTTGTLQRREEVFEEFRAERMFPLFRFPIERFPIWNH